METKKQRVADFINYLRYKKRKQVKRIMKETGLTRVTLNKLEKQAQTVTEFVEDAFINAYGSLFTDYIRDGTTSEKKEETKKESTGTELSKAIAEIATKYTAIVDQYIIANKEITRLRGALAEKEKEIRRLRGIIDNLS